MRSLKFIFPKIPFTSILTGMFLALFLIGCGQTGDRQTTIGPGAANNFSSPIPTQLQKLRTGLNARVIVDGGTINEKIFPLDVDKDNDQVIGTIPELLVGEHTFQIQYFIDHVLIAETSVVRVNIRANVNNDVPFTAALINTDIDTDGDGFTNLNEVEIFGSASDAWTNPDLKPEVSVVVNPGTAILPPNGVQTFTAAIAQNANQGVTWSLEEPTGGGSITPGGTYTAGTTLGTFNVVATSQADPAKTSTIAVEVINPGSIDLSFDTDGIVSTTTGTDSSITALAVQTDGKMVAGGYSNVHSSGQYHFTLRRYNTDGSIDTSFGTGGIVNTVLGTQGFPNALVIQPDGKIIIAGQSNLPVGANTAFHFTLVRYETNGSLDTSFGTNGSVKTILGTSSSVSSLAIQSDGKIIAAGNSNLPVGANTEFHFTLVRYETNGSLDTSFGTNGSVKTILGTSSFPNSLTIQSDGKIIAAGNSNLPVGANTAFHFTLVRYETNGSLDASFGTNGSIKTILGTGSFASSLAIQSDGKIIAAGNSNLPVGANTASHFTLVRYETNGSLDASFGTNGSVKFILGSNSFGNSLKIQPNGKIIAAGGSNIINSNQVHFTLIRLQTSAPSVLLRANLSGSEEVPAVTTLATGSATFVISPGQTEISYTLHIADIGISGVTAVQIHFGAPGEEGRALFTLTSSPFISPLTGTLTAADLERIAATEGINTFSDAIKAMRDGNTYLHVHTSTHLGGEIRGQIREAPPTLSLLQAQIFSQKCDHCHTPGGPGGNETGLFLDSLENSFSLLVNVPSTQDPNFKRVEPLDPDASFLVKKLTDPTLGLMPAGGPPLPAEEIKKVRDWISAGAKND